MISSVLVKMGAMTHWYFKQVPGPDKLAWGFRYSKLTWILSQELNMLQKSLAKHLSSENLNSNLAYTRFWNTY